MMLECDNLTYQYPTSQTPIFQNLTFRLQEPGFHALFGSSGVGKTTLARIIAGQINGFSGAIRTQQMPKVLYSYNSEKLPGWTSVHRHLMDVAVPACLDQIPALAAAFGLTPHIASRFTQLSLGQQNRANLTRYLLQDFSMLIMDESLANVDEATRETIIFTIKKKFPDKCFLYISHNLVEVARFCQEILVLRGPGKTPPMAMARGFNQTQTASPATRDLEPIMLEIVHAS
jgi:ABC-type multidrug transport system ATPase subunit